MALAFIATTKALATRSVRIIARVAFAMLCAVLMGQVPHAPQMPQVMPRVPIITVQGGACAVDVHFSLQALEPEIRSVALLVAPHRGPVATHGNAEPLGVSDGHLVREIDRAVFDAMSHIPGAAFSLPVHLGPPDIDCDTDYVVVAAVRDNTGTLIEDYGELGQSVSTRAARGDWGLVYATPSGPVQQFSVHPTMVVLGRDPSTGAIVPTVVRSVHPSNSSDAVRVVLSDGRRIAAPAHARYAVGAGFRLATELRAGDRLVDLQGASVTVVSTDPAEGGCTNEAPGVDVAWPDNVFVDGLLIADAGERPSTAPAGAHASVAMAHEDVSWTAMASFDCELDTQLDVRTLPADASGVALMIAPYRGMPGARVPLACDPHRVVVDISRAALDATRQAVRARPGDPVSIGIQLEGRPIQCDGQYAIQPCVRSADGSLALASPSQTARWALAGSSCLAGETLVDTPTGSVAIESLREGNAVYAWEDGRRVETHVRHLAVRAEQPVATFQLSNGRNLRATATHVVYALAQGAYVPAQELGPGDTLLSEDGTPVTIQSRTDFTESATVYDLSVAPPHNYFASGVLVHNY